ncbi:hypothetical protein DL93DRAFT_2226502 [Clavulina sp. PMI_390]|nr:hypothetical protein DL93DRAFT_2226502 [Clavulina sp. PMI_390]
MLTSYMSNPPVRANGRVQTVTEAPIRRGSNVPLRQNPRARLASAVSPASSSFSARKRAITISGDGLSAPLSRGSSTDPVLLELKSGLLLNVGNVLDHFTDFQRDVQSFCDKTADHLSRYKGTPRFSAEAAAPRNSPVTKPASDFPSVEEFIYFILLSIMNTRLYSDIFLPFHPCAGVDENRRWEEEYRNVIDRGKHHTDLQPQAAAWRAKTYSTIEDGVEPSAINALLDRISQSIINNLGDALQDLPGELPLSKAFSRELKSLLGRAYRWNRSIKVDVLKYDFEIFVVEPSSRWDSLQMEPFERLRTAIGAESKVVSPVALGIIASVSLDGARVSHVVRKALVLVYEWFGGNSRGRTISTVPPAYNPSRQQPAMSSPPSHSSACPPFSLQTTGTQPLPIFPMLTSLPQLTPQPLNQDFFSNIHMLGTCPSYSIGDLCLAVAQMSSENRSAPITELRWFNELSWPYHEFLLVKIDLPRSGGLGYSGLISNEPIPIWVRLERRASPWGSSVNSSSSSFSAVDTAVLCCSRERLENLSGPGTCTIASTMKFDSPPSLADLESLLGAFQEIWPNYNLLTENCYFFCSLVQQVLRETYGGKIIRGKSSRDVHPNARQRIQTALERLHRTTLTLPELDRVGADLIGSRALGNHSGQQRGCLTSVRYLADVCW